MWLHVNDQLVINCNDSRRPCLMLVMVDINILCLISFLTKMIHSFVGTLRAEFCWFSKSGLSKYALKLGKP